eukprot:6204400-Pleurochrysis_carterae.AAC.1
MQARAMPQFLARAVSPSHPPLAQALSIAAILAFVPFLPSSPAFLRVLFQVFVSPCLLNWYSPRAL